MQIHAPSPAARWTIVAVAVIIALVAAIWPQQTVSDYGHHDIDRTIAELPIDPTQLAKARRDAKLLDCDSLQPNPSVADSAFGRILLPCLGTGKPVNMGAITAGKPALLNFWGHWCSPCKKELPVLNEFSQRAKGALNVLLVHGKDGANQLLALEMLIKTGVHLAAVVDEEASLAVALKVPRVYPLSVFLRADGTVAKVLPKVFVSSEEIAEAVRTYLGVRV